MLLLTSLTAADWGVGVVGMVVIIVGVFLLLLLMLIVVAVVVVLLLMGRRASHVIVIMVPVGVSVGRRRGRGEGLGPLARPGRAHALRVAVPRRAHAAVRRREDVVKVTGRLAAPRSGRVGSGRGVVVVGLGLGLGAGGGGGGGRGGGGGEVQHAVRLALPHQRQRQPCGQVAQRLRPHPVLHHVPGVVGGGRAPPAVGTPPRPVHPVAGNRPLALTRMTLTLVTLTLTLPAPVGPAGAAGLSGEGNVVAAVVHGGLVAVVVVDLLGVLRDGRVTEVRPAAGVPLPVPLPAGHILVVGGDGGGVGEVVVGGLVAGVGQGAHGVRRLLDVLLAAGTDVAAAWLRAIRVRGGHRLLVRRPLRLKHKQQVRREKNRVGGGGVGGGVSLF